MLSHQSHGEGISPPSKHDEVVENERLSAEGKEETAMVSDGGVASPSLPLWSFSSVRLTIAIALALSLAIEGLMRSNINMAMVCMVNKTAISLMTPHSDHQHKFFDNASLTSTSPRQMAECVHMAKQFKNLTKLFDDGDLIISKREQSLIFTSFYLGGLLIILPGSFLCDWLGPTRLVFYGALLNVFGTFSTPFVARHFGSVALLVVRFLMGCGQGILVPCVNVLIAHWFPLSEKSTAIAISTTGNQISVVLAMFITAELCVAQSLGGWASSFYIYGVIGAAFCAIWLLLVRDYPFQSKRIRSDELRLIETHGGRAKGLQKINPNDVPWRHILGSMVVWSTGFSSFSQNFMNVGIVVYLPTYYHDVLGMNLASNGLMSALPFIVQLLTKILFAGIADWLKERRLMSSSAVTKLFNLVASFGSGLCFVLLSFCDCRTPYLAISLAICAIGISSGFIPGYNTSVVCIAPLYISSIASFSRLLGQIASVVSPYGIGIVVANGSKVAWQFAFCGMAAILFSTGVIFQCFGSASVQEWAIIPPAVDPSHEAPYHLVKLDADNENEEEKRKEQNVVGEESK